MSNYNFEGQPDGDWDDRGDLSWQEYDWQRYLARHEDEVEKFIEVYNRLKDQPAHLDEVAHEMGWDAGDWSVTDPEEDDFYSEDEEEEEASAEDFDPYTVLRHPVYIVVRGLYRYLRLLWNRALVAGTVKPGLAAATRFSDSLCEGEVHGTLALQSLDMGDFQLAVCQIKLILRELNHSFDLLPALFCGRSPGEGLLDREIRVRLFDLREVCLRVMNDCREEIRRRGESGDE